MKKKAYQNFILLTLGICICGIGARFLTHSETLADYAKKQAKAKEETTIEEPAIEEPAIEEPTIEEPTIDPTITNETSTDGSGVALGPSPVELSPEIIERITDCSYHENPNISIDELRYLQLTYYGFDNETHFGELICHMSIADDLLEIFEELYQQHYPLESVRLVDDFDADDDRSMEANNTSCFNYREKTSGSSLSKHAYGLAIDINPLYNPYIHESPSGALTIAPTSGEPYLDREQNHPYLITHEDLCYQLFTEHGFTWGGDWKNRTKDYQHFEK